MPNLGASHDAHGAALAAAGGAPDGDDLHDRLLGTIVGALRLTAEQLQQIDDMRESLRLSAGLSLHDVAARELPQPDIGTGEPETTDPATIEKKEISRRVLRASVWVSFIGFVAYKLGTIEPLTAVGGLYEVEHVYGPLRDMGLGSLSVAFLGGVCTRSFILPFAEGRLGIGEEKAPEGQLSADQIRSMLAIGITVSSYIPIWFACRPFEVNDTLIMANGDRVEDGFFSKTYDSSMTIYQMYGEAPCIYYIWMLTQLTYYVANGSLACCKDSWVKRLEGLAKDCNDAFAVVFISGLLELSPLFFYYFGGVNRGGSILTPAATFEHKAEDITSLLRGYGFLPGNYSLDPDRFSVTLDNEFFKLCYEGQGDTCFNVSAPYRQPEIPRLEIFKDIFFETGVELGLVGSSSPWDLRVCGPSDRFDGVELELTEVDPSELGSALILDCSKIEFNYVWLPCASFFLVVFPLIRYCNARKLGAVKFAMELYKTMSEKYMPYQYGEFVFVFLFSAIFLNVYSTEIAERPGEIVTSLESLVGVNPGDENLYAISLVIAFTWVSGELLASAILLYEILKCIKSGISCGSEGGDGCRAWLSTLWRRSPDGGHTDPLLEQGGQGGHGATPEYP